MTGGTSGFGKVAAENILATPDTRLFLGTRRKQVAGAEHFPLDLADLASVRAFVAAITGRLGSSPINSLILNAGLSLPSDGLRTIDGFETTFAVNHLAQYLILRSLGDRLAPGARVVITTSDAHDPAINSFAPPQYSDARHLAHRSAQSAASSGAFKRGLRAYSESKLCNLLTAGAFSEQVETKRRNIIVIAYNPGFTPGTGINRAAPLLLRIAIGTIGPVLRPLLRLNRIGDAGEMLASLALGAIHPPPNRIYASQVKRRLTWPDPSEVARRPDVRDALWRDSADLMT